MKEAENPVAVEDVEMLAGETKQVLQLAGTETIDIAVDRKQHVCCAAVRAVAARAAL